LWVSATLMAISARTNPEHTFSKDINGCATVSENAGEEKPGLA
jgi:hypothetical protein